MVEHTKTLPHQIAYDRPSSKLFPFLKRHYNLAAFIP